MGSRLKQREANNQSSLHSEVVALFGRQIVERAKSVNINQMVIEAELVAEAAKQLRQQAGSPESQKAIIAAMDTETALALCRWIIDPQCMAGFIVRAAN